jgi:hypothetical protein
VIYQRIRGITKEPFTPTLFSVEEGEFERVDFTEKDYQEAVQRLKEHYPKIGQRVHKTATKSWKQIYEEMLEIIEKEKWTPTTSKTKTKTNR